MIPYGSLVVFVTPKGRRYIKRLEEGRDWHSNDGTLPAAQVAALDFGSETSTTLGVPIRVLEATLFDRLQGIKRQTQIIYAKDIAYICLRLGAGPGRTIIEAGCGSGGLTVGFSWFCGPTGKVVSHDAREEFTRLARRNLDWAGVGGNVELHPEDRMTAHTGFLVFCRQQECSEDFESRRPMGTRERKQEAARLARLGLTAPGADAMPDGDEA